MNRRNSSPKARRRAVWTAVTLTCLYGTMVHSDWVSSEEASPALPASSQMTEDSTADAGDVSRKAASGDPRADVQPASTNPISTVGTQASQAESKVRPPMHPLEGETGRATLADDFFDGSSTGEEQGWQQTEPGDPKWQTHGPDNLKWQPTVQDAPRWRPVANAEQPGTATIFDDQLSLATITNEQPGRATIDDHPLCDESIVDAVSGRASIQDDGSGRAYIVDDLDHPLKRVVSDQREATEIKTSDLNGTNSEELGPLPFISSLDDKTSEEGESAGHLPRIVSDSSKNACEPSSKVDHSLSIPNGWMPADTDKSSELEWLSAVEADEAVSSEEGQDAINGDHPLADNPFEFDNESLPIPPRRSKSVVPVSAIAQGQPQRQHPLQEQVEGPALSRPSPTSVDGSEPAAETTIGLSDLPITETGKRKSSSSASSTINSPRRIRLAQTDDLLRIGPPSNSVETEPIRKRTQTREEPAPLLGFPDDRDEGRDFGSSQLSDQGSDGVLQDDQKLGEAPEDTSLSFLRRQTVLLKPGEFQIDISFQYLNDKADFVAIRDQNGLVQVAEAQRRQRLLMVPMQLRVGITEFTQLFVNMPVGWANSETAFLGDDQAKSSGGIGDVSAGFIKQVVVGNEFYPDVLTSLSFSAPTGESTFLTALSTPGTNLGEGFWSATAALTFIQSYDPIVLFYGGGFRYRFQNKFEGQFKVDPGNQIFYRLGIGFAVNPNVTLSASFLGSYIGETEVNGEYVGGSTQEPMQIRLAATINKRKKSKTHSSVKLVEPFITFGLNDDAIDTILGITWTH